MVKILRLIVQKTSIFVKDFNENIFEQIFLEFTHKWKLSSWSIFREKHKNPFFSNIPCWMSSYRDEFQCMKMKSLDVLDTFCTVFEYATTSRIQFRASSIFAIFQFWFFEFSPFDHRNFDIKSFVGFICFVFRKYHHKPLSEKNGPK